VKRREDGVVQMFALHDASVEAFALPTQREWNLRESSSTVSNWTMTPLFQIMCDSGKGFRRFTTL